ncbi:MAG: DUF5674 family protein [Calditrichaceae bacterium]
MHIINSKINLSEIWENRKVQNTDLLKIVVDVGRKLIAVDAEMHADLEELLLQNGSEQNDLWGANLFPGKKDDEFIEYTSFINIRPAQGNRDMEVKDEKIKSKIQEIVNTLIEN